MSDIIVPYGQLYNHTKNDIVEFVKNYIVTHSGSPPSIRDITRGCGISSTSVTKDFVGRLIEEGKLTRIPGVPVRNIVPVEQDNGEA